MKFKYGDDVKVISGFYEGLEGVVLGVESHPLMNFDTAILYEVEMHFPTELGARQPTDWINEDYLERI